MKIRKTSPKVSDKTQKKRKKPLKKTSVKKSTGKKSLRKTIAKKKKPIRRKKKTARGKAEALRATLLTVIALLSAFILVQLFILFKGSPERDLSSDSIQEEREITEAPKTEDSEGPIRVAPTAETSTYEDFVPKPSALPNGGGNSQKPEAGHQTNLAPSEEKLPKLEYWKPRPPSVEGTKIAFVIDDAGNNLKELDDFLSIPGPLTIAVLPALPYSREAARRIRAAGKEVILHQPMEALGGENPGPGAIYTNMSEREIRAVLRRNIDEIGPIVGMNNHQGSKVSEDRRIINILLSFCREEGLFFLDSRTTPNTVAPRIAQEKGMHILERDIFLDNQPERAYILRSFEEGLKKADRKGAAVMIGHTWSLELANTLHELYPELIKAGWSLSTITQLMMHEILIESLDLGDIAGEGPWD